VHISANKAKSLASKPKPSAGTVVLTLTCDEAAQVTLTGQLTELVRHRRQLETFRFSPVRASAQAGVAARLTIKLPKPALNRLSRSVKTQASFTVVATNINGSATILTKAATLKPAS
jgi:hypothetical protein